VTLSLMNLAYSFTVRDEVRSVFNLDTLADRTFLIASGISFLAIVFAAQSGVMERILKTTSLDFNKWLLCLGAALIIVVASELYKLLTARRR